ncbi:hypothetical protein GGI25_001466 [Coemansia spiralis]|uniref:Actin-like ATPase domain-containing protein n=2 Tax=Coemansia TaxID=4863 RepID=A0A9W8GAZ8_9FUNG|nr:hypothetical protein EDC05_001429 [Coemansia umbellata]KAJ2624492.1 hypothetical protein GGI26_001410 [Coemansia sp. RSA 1358]KAJ2679543.1 hypothetical protein GGI25_001466 [Coemansia spiralis]
MTSSPGISDSFNTLGFDVSNSRKSFLDTSSSRSLSTPRRPLSSTTGLLSSSLYSSSSAEEKVILDLGTFTLRAGFSGDPTPTHKEELFGVFKTAGETNRLVGEKYGLLVHPEDMLESLMLEQLRQVYRQHLLLDAKTKKVAVVESPLLPIPVKRALLKALLGNLRVPQVSFYPAPVLALMTCGRNSGLVVDCGHRGSVVAPVYDSRPLTSYLVSSPLGGHLLFANLRALLKQFASFTRFDDGQKVDLSSLQDDLCDGVLSDRVVYHLMTRILYTSSVALPMANIRKPGMELGVGVVGSRLVDWFESSVTANSSTMRLTIDSPQYGRVVLEFPSWVRERSTEVFFAGDTIKDHVGLVDAIVQCIERAPVDIRRTLVNNILVVGGVSDMPNFRIRLLHDLVAKLRLLPRWSALADEAALADERSGNPTKNSANGTVFRASERPWIGASIAVASKIGGIDVRRDEFDEFLLPDWTGSTT